MDFVSKYQGVVGRVFRNDNSNNSDDSYVERLLDRISNGALAEDRRNAMVELQAIVAESQTAQIAFGAMGFPVLLAVLKEERDDIELIRGALETFLCALNPISHAKMSKDEVQPSLMNSDLLSREVDSISLLLSLLSEEDFYIRYYTLQLLTALLSNSQNRLQEAILTIPRGITRLMDMLMDREVIRNEALLLLTYLTREAEEIQKILVFEGAFEKIFSIIKEEGDSEGGVVVQDGLELLNNLIRNNASNQVLLRETVGFDPLISILQLRGRTYKFTQQKTVNIISVLDTINLLLHGSPQTDPGKDSNAFANKMALVQKKVIDHLLVLGVESQWAPVAVRCMALRCIGDLVADHPKNRDAFASKLLGEDTRVEPALNSILRITLRTSSLQEVAAADHVFKSFCEGNPDGQEMLCSTLVSPALTSDVTPFVEDIDRSFGSILLHRMVPTEDDGNLEICCRASSVLSHVLKDNTQCKEKVLQIELEAPSSLGGTEPLMHRMVKLLAVSLSNSKDRKSGASDPAYVQPIILKLLITWLHNCPAAVQFFLESRPHLTYLLELITDQNATVLVRGLTATVLAECAIFNKSSDSKKNAFSIVDAVSQKVGLTSFFLKFEEMQKSLLFGSTDPTTATRKQPLARSASASMSEIEDVNETEALEQGNNEVHHPMLAMALDSRFVQFVKGIEKTVRERILEIYSRPTNQVAVVPADLEQENGESDQDYIERLKSFVEKQCREIQDLLARNAALADDLTKTSGAHEPQLEQRASNASDKVMVETLRRDLHEANQRVEALKAEKSKIETEASTQKNLARKLESDLESLSSAYNSLEQTNLQLEREIQASKNGGASPRMADIEAIKAEAREEAQRESEAELNDLLVCLGQEQNKVEKLSTRLTELGDDVDKLLEGIGDDLAQDNDDDDDDAEDE